MERINVEIITIGDEILIGQIVDTNSAWMAAELNKAGFEILQITSIHDNAELMISELEAALTRADIVLLTGGIGPTKDDITKETLCRFFDTKLVFSHDVYANIETLFAKRSGVINELTKAQAMVPENSTIIQNKLGTAPITWFEKEGKIIVSMPGVPYEMKAVMSSEIIPRLKVHFNTPAILHKTLLAYGYPESSLAIKIADWEDSLPEYIRLAYLPNYGIIRLRLSGFGDDLLSLEFIMNQQIDRVKDILGEAIVCDEDLSPEQLIGKILKQKDKTISTAESCTGGNIAHLITTVPGSSQYFKGGIVSYDNEVKTNILRVSAEDIERHGAVSQVVVEQMANSVMKLLKTDFAIATSGIAGPGGGSNEKPVGTVWIAVCSHEKTMSKLFHFPYGREQIIERASLAALMMVREIL